MVHCNLGVAESAEAALITKKKIDTYEAFEAVSVGSSLGFVRGFLCHGMALGYPGSQTVTHSKGILSPKAIELATRAPKTS